MVLLGYEEGTKAYQLYDPRGGKVVFSRDLMFDKKATWEWDGPRTGEAGGFSSTFVVEHLVVHSGGDARDEVPTTPVAELITTGAVLSTPTGVSTTLVVVPSSPVVVPTITRRVPSAPVAEPSGPAVVPTTPGLVSSTPTVC